MTRVPGEALAAVRAVEAVLGRAPAAAVLSGSAVDGGLRPLSDVDVLVLVEDAPDADARPRLPADLGAWLELAGRAYVGARDDDWSNHRAEAAAVAERLRREVEAACKGRFRGPMASPTRRG